MVALVAGDGFELAALRRHVHTHLSPYARPLFLRLQTEIETTSTFKQRKVELVRDGFDPGKVAEPLYFDDATAGAYVRLDAELFRKIQAGEVRL
jgi:fatty-acyl-CoA synthase